MAVAASGRAVPGVGHDGLSLGGPLPRTGCGGNGRPLLTPTPQPEPNPARRTEKRILRACDSQRRWGPARIGYLLGVHPSTVHRVLSRYGMARLRWLDRSTGRVIRRIASPNIAVIWCTSTSRSSARSPPVEGGGCWPARPANATSRPTNPAACINKYRNPLHGHHFLHTAIDGHSRLAYSELLADERKETAAAFWIPCRPWFIECGITVRKVLTDNGSCYPSHVFDYALDDIEHRRTQPDRPQTNGKIERFHRTLADEWAYARLYPSDVERCAEFTTWRHTDNHHRGHTALGGQPPASRVPNLSGQYTVAAERVYRSARRRPPPADRPRRSPGGACRPARRCPARRPPR